VAAVPVCRSGYYHAPTAAPTARPIYINRDREDLIKAFILCSLDYSNSLIYCGLMSQLRYLQTAAARLVSDARRYDHITPVLQELHWLPVRRRVDFKMATRGGLVTTVYLSGKAPAYLAARYHLVSDEGRRQLLSSTSRTCIVRRTCRNYGEFVFAAAGPKLWNSLPADLRQADINF